MNLKIRNWFRQNNLKELQEDTLKFLFSLERKKLPLNPDLVSSRFSITKDKVERVLLELMRTGLIHSLQGELTNSGRKKAIDIVRKHRTYEKYLAEKSGYHPSEWHEIACRKEHFISEEEQGKIINTLNCPLFDPHGDPIPSENGEMVIIESIKLKEAEPGRILKVTKVSDTPASVFNRIFDCGIMPGTRMKIIEKAKCGIRIITEGENYVLSEEESSLIRVTEDKECDEASFMDIIRLSSLKENEFAEITGISKACGGIKRRRLLDLGFVRGSTVSIDLTNPFGNPTAYIIRGTSIALRADQARYILIRKHK